ncbi:hypothetical protein DFH29DRAFT_940253 [Suillus ampliporus]|nr:hypothetical protein DFH29DRAFT_940253 [Suillus ampliporus]
MPEAQGSASANKNSSIRHLLNSHATRRPAVVHHHPATSPVISLAHTQHRPLPTINPQQPSLLRNFRKVLRFSSCTITIPPVRNDQVHDLLEFPATSVPHKRSLSELNTTNFDDFETTSPPNRLTHSAYGGSQHPARHSRTNDLVNHLLFHRQVQQTHLEEESLRPSNGITQFLRQHLVLHRSTLGHEPPVVEVAPGRKVTRLAAANVPEYMKVDDTRHPSRQQLAVSQDMKETYSSSESSDIDSLPDVHWCKAFFCYYSCWSHGRLRMPPRWRLENVDHQDGTLSSSCGGAHGRS